MTLLSNHQSKLPAQPAHPYEDALSVLLRACQKQPVGSPQRGALALAFANLACEPTGTQKDSHPTSIPTRHKPFIMGNGKIIPNPAYSNGTSSTNLSNNDTVQPSRAPDSDSGTGSMASSSFSHPRCLLSQHLTLNVVFHDNCCSYHITGNPDHQYHSTASIEAFY